MNASSATDPTDGLRDISNEVDLLSRMIATPSFSRDEGRTADIIYEYLACHGADLSDMSTTSGL